jgi:hypothetical protein
VEFLMPHEGNEDDGLLLWLNGRDSLNESPIEIIESSGQLKQPRSAGLELAIVDHKIGTQIGKLQLLFSEKELIAVNAEAWRDFAVGDLVAVFCDLVRAHPEYALELQRSYSAIKRLRRMSEHSAPPTSA